MCRKFVNLNRLELPADPLQTSRRLCSQGDHKDAHCFTEWMDLTRKKKELLCGYCRKSCSTPWNLKIHVQRKHSEKAQPARPGLALFRTTTQVHSTKNIVEHSNYQDTSLSHHPEAYRRQNGQLFPKWPQRKKILETRFIKLCKISVNLKKYCSTAMNSKIYWDGHR